jgi:hypothetical protein
VLVVNQMEVSQDGYSTFIVTLDLDSPSVSNVFAIFGDEEVPMSFPPSLQLDAPWGSNVGPVRVKLQPP